MFLSASILEKVVEFLKKYDFSGLFYLSGYDEPLSDPRMSEFVRYVKKSLPKCTIGMFTNGKLLDSRMMREIVEAGVDVLRLSIYSKSEHERLIKEHASSGVNNVCFHPRYDKAVTDEGAGEDMDDRIHNYDFPGTCLQEPCYMPVMYYFVRNTGEVHMCFRDWQYDETFGNLYTDSVEDTLVHPRRIEIINTLVYDRDRMKIPVCSGCRLPVMRCVSEYCGRMNI